VTEADLAPLPPIAAWYLRAMGMVGGPRTWSLRAHFTGHFRRGPDQPWLPVDAWQYNSGVELARVFRMRLLVARLRPLFPLSAAAAPTLASHISTEQYLSGLRRILDGLTARTLTRQS